MISPQVVAMCVSLFGGGADAVGTTTSGGTESIIMAVKAHRDHARKVLGQNTPFKRTPLFAFVQGSARGREGRGRGVGGGERKSECV